MKMKKYKMPCGCELKTNDIKGCKEKTCRHGYGYETGEKMSTDLKTQVLNTLAKENTLGYDSYKDWKEDINESNFVWFIYIECAVELALETKQAEVENIIDIFLADSDMTDNGTAILIELKKRLVEPRAKKEVRK